MTDIALDEKALQRAFVAAEENAPADSTYGPAIKAAIRAYLEAVPSPSQVAPANPEQGVEQTWQKPGERAAQGTPADEQSGETGHVANPAPGVTDFRPKFGASEPEPDLLGEAGGDPAPLLPLDLPQAGRQDQDSPRARRSALRVVKG